MELKFENNDKEKQRVDCNAYDENGKLHHTVRIAYLTKEQIDFLDTIKERLIKKEMNSSDKGNTPTI